MGVHHDGEVELDKKDSAQESCLDDDVAGLIVDVEKMHLKEVAVG